MCKKIIITINFLFWSSICCFGYSNDTIDRIEYSNYGQLYSNESLGERLNRLETDLLGLEQTGDLDTRVNNLGRISNTQIQNPTVAFNDNFYPPKKNGFKNFMDNIASTFSNTNTYTGFIPPMNYSNNYSRPWGNSNYCPYHKRVHNSRIDYGRNRNFNSFPHNPPHSPYPHNFRRPPQNQISSFSTKSGVRILDD